MQTKVELKIEKSEEWVDVYRTLLSANSYKKLRFHIVKFGYSEKESPIEELTKDFDVSDCSLVGVRVEVVKNGS